MWWCILSLASSCVYVYIWSVCSQRSSALQCHAIPCSPQSISNRSYWLLVNVKWLSSSRPWWIHCAKPREVVLHRSSCCSLKNEHVSMLNSPSLSPHTTVLTDGSDKLSWPVMSVGGYCCKKRKKVENTQDTEH